MLRFILLLFIGTTLFDARLTAQNSPESKQTLFVGSFSERESKGIYVFEFNPLATTAKLIQTISDGVSPSFIALHPNGQHLYAVYRQTSANPDGAVIAYSIDADTKALTKLNEHTSEGASPPHVSVDPRGRFVYVSNYQSGTLSVIKINNDGSLGKTTMVINHGPGSQVNKGRQEQAHVHAAIPSKNGKLIYVPDLGMDAIMVYRVSKKGKLLPASPSKVTASPGSGPRHFVLHPDKPFAYCVEELSSTVTGFAVDRKTGALQVMQRVAMLPDKFSGQNDAADIHLSPDGRHLYASNRGHESIAIFSVDQQSGKLHFIGHQETYGKHPRNFMMDKRGEFLLVGNKESDEIVYFSRDASTGLLSNHRVIADVKSVSCIISAK